MEERNTQDTISLIGILRLLYKRKWIIVIITLLGSIGGFLYAWVSLLIPQDRTYLKNYYIPVAHVIIREASSYNLDDLLRSSGLENLAQLGNISGSGAKVSELAMRIGFMDSFVDKIAQRFDFDTLYGLRESSYPRTAARSLIKQNLRFSYDATSSLMSIGYQSPDKLLAADIVNYAVQLLEEQFQKISVDKNQTQLDMITRKLGEVESEISRLQGEVMVLEEKYHTFDIAAMAKEQASHLASMRAQLVQKGLEIDAYTRAVGIEDPALRKLRIDRETLQRSIEKLEKGYRDGDILVPAESELPKLVLEYTRIQGDLDVQRTILETLIQQQEVLKLEVASVLPTFQIYEYAEVPEIKSGPSRTKLCVAVAAASLIAGIFAACMVEYFHRALKDSKSAQKPDGMIEGT